MTHSRDQQHLDLDDGWTGELVLTDERPDTALAPDPRDRKWMLIGLGIAGVLAAGFVLVASFGGEPTAPQTAEPSVAIEPADAPTTTEAAPAPAATPTPAPKLAVAEPKPRPKPRKPPPVPNTTFASGTPAAVQPHAAPATPPPKPTAPPPKPQPAATPTQPAPDPALPTPEPALPQTGDELPDVQAWDDADDDALRELSEPIEPG